LYSVNRKQNHLRLAQRQSIHQSWFIPDPFADFHSGFAEDQEKAPGLCIKTLVLSWLKR